MDVQKEQIATQQQELVKLVSCLTYLTLARVLQMLLQMLLVETASKNVPNNAIIFRQLPTKLQLTVRPLTSATQLVQLTLANALIIINQQAEVQKHAFPFVEME